MKSQFSSPATRVVGMSMESMAKFREPVSIFMSTPVHCVAENASLVEAQEQIHKLGMSCLAVLAPSREATLSS